MKHLFTALVLISLLSCSTEKAQDRDKHFTNPILAGFYPDPSICKVGEDFYLVTSTFTYFPGIPVFHSKDLVNWKLLSHVFEDPDKFDVEGSGVSRGVFAPSIRYHKGVFYITCTLVDKGGNFFSTTTDPAKGWSDPVWIQEIDGIDPSPFFDDDGRAYLIYNSVAPDNKPLYGGHRSLRLWEFDPENLQLIGEEVMLVNGGVDISKNPVWIEAPHIFKKYGYYYLIAAEGGTAYEHSEVVFRSESVNGPYVPYENNPILTQRHLDPDRPNPVTTAGHADFIETDDGEWWAVFLGCRPYAPKNYFNTGRETFLAPVRWENEWPVINPDFEEVQYTYSLPLPTNMDGSTPLSGNFVVKDDFTAESLRKEWMFLRAPKEKWYSLDEKDGWLSMKLRPETCTEKVNPSFMGHRQQHLNGSAEIRLDFVPMSDNEKAGLLVFQNELHYYYICKTLDEAGSPIVGLYKSPTDEDAQATLLKARPLRDVNSTVQLKVNFEGEYYKFHFLENNDEWQLLQDKVDARFLSTEVAGGFVGCVLALYATSEGEKTENIAHFDWFEYEGSDDVYKNKTPENNDESSR